MPKRILLHGWCACHGNIQCDGSTHYCPAVRTVHDWVANNVVPGNVLLGGIASLGAISQQIECGYGLSIPVYCPAGSDSPKTDVGNGYTYCPITSPQGIHCSNMTREAKLIVKKAMPVKWQYH